MPPRSPRSLLVAVAAPRVRVVRFTEPDILDQVDWDGSAEGCGLMRELLDSALGDLQSGETLVLNLGLVERFTSNVYRFLLGVRREVARREGRLLLCCLSPAYEQVCKILQADRLFRFTSTEAEALRVAGAPEQLRA